MGLGLGGINCMMLEPRGRLKEKLFQTGFEGP